MHTDEEPWHGIVEERAWYAPVWREEAERQGAIIAAATEDLPVSAVYYGTQAMLMYYARLPVAVEGHVGLTDHELARMPPPDGSRVGHGSKATIPYLRSRGVDLAFNFRVHQQTTPFTLVDFGQGVKARLLVYRPEVVDGLRARGVAVPDFPAYLDAYLSHLDQLDPQRVAADLETFEVFYFEPSGDTARRAAILAYLEAPKAQAPPSE